ncbi:MAG: chromate efflux transporter [Acidobacteria bacterium]|nr:chromate efflux transporter [Acidobacteriota bacterium]
MHAGVRARPEAGRPAGDHPRHDARRGGRAPLPGSGEELLPRPDRRPPLRRPDLAGEQARAPSGERLRDGRPRLGNARLTATFREALRFWVKLGFINFGGPAGQIALMHREIVERKRWIGEEQFLRALNFCMILPGPEAQQLAIYVGWLMHGTIGGVVAGVFFVLPSVFVLLALSWLVAAHAQVPAIGGLLYGVQPVVIAIVVEAVLRIGRRALRHRALYLFAGAAFAGIHFLSIPFPLIIAAAATAGIALQRALPGALGPPRHAVPAGHAAPAAARPGSATYPPATRALRIAALFAALWAAPVAGLWLRKGGSDVLVQEALFFTQAAFVTFGGAYAVLSYIADVAVNHFHWLSAAQMVQGLGLAESTPGPLIMVTQYVGFLGAWSQPGALSPAVNGALGALITTYVTFLFCFMFIFIGAPYVEALAGSPRVQAALTGVTSAVVGVILNLAVYFGARVLFSAQGALDPFALVLAVLSFVALQRFRVPVPYAVAAGALVGLAWRLLGGGA